MAEDKSFTVVPNVIFGVELSVQEQSLYLALLSFYNKEKGYAYPSYKQLKERSRIKKDETLIKYINSLIQKKLLVKETIKGKGNKYYIPTPKTEYHQNWSTSEKGGTPTPKKEEHLLQKRSTTNTNTNTNTNTIYSSSEEEVSSEGSIKANTTQEPIKKEIDRKYLEIFEYWNSLKIIKHKECNEEIIKAIDKALKKYDIETIKLAINNYNTVFKFEYWNSLKIIKHKECNEEIIKAIDKALKKYDIETIKLAINNYNTVFKDKRHYYKHRWVLKNFLTQGNGISEFLEDGQQYINYQDKLVEYEKEKNKPSSEEEIKIKETDFS